MLASFGRRQEALRQVEQAAALDPIGIVTLQDVGMVYWILKDYDRVRQYSATLLELNDRFPGGYLLKAIADWEAGDLESAAKEIEKAIPLGLPYGMTIPALFWGMSGQRDRAEEVLDKLLDPEPGKYVFAGEIAVVCAGLGDLDSTFEYLNKAVHQNETVPFNSLIRQLPGVEEDQRFKELLRRVGLPVEE
jgi:tetratricopeptide (TPR) repeat protein